VVLRAGDSQGGCGVAKGRRPVRVPESLAAQSHEQLSAIIVAQAEVIQELQALAQ
jgi:hypothetical protein